MWLALPLGRRLEIVADQIDTGRALALAGLRLRYPDLSDRDRFRIWVERRLGPGLAERVYGPRPDHLPVGAR